MEEPEKGHEPPAQPLPAAKAALSGVSEGAHVIV
jgi:hypothetical protein